MTEVKLNVPDVECDHCIHTVTTALKELQGVDEVNVDLATKKVDVRYDAAKVNEQKIREALDEAGYPVA
jgi:copper chaperone